MKCNEFRPGFELVSPCSFPTTITITPRAPPGFFVKWHINLCRLFNAKAILLEEQLWYYLTHSWEDKGVHTFPKGICPKVNVIARLEYHSLTTIPLSITLTITPRGHPPEIFLISRYMKTSTKRILEMKIKKIPEGTAITDCTFGMRKWVRYFGHKYTRVAQKSSKFHPERRA